MGHAPFHKFAWHNDINLNPQSDAVEIKDGTVDAFKYLEGTIHRDDVAGLVYEAA